MNDKIHWQRCEGTKDMSHPPVLFPRYLWVENGLPQDGGCPVCTAKVSIGEELKALLKMIGLAQPEAKKATPDSDGSEQKH